MREQQLSSAAPSAHLYTRTARTVQEQLLSGALMCVAESVSGLGVDFIQLCLS